MFKCKEDPEEETVTVNSGLKLNCIYSHCLSIPLHFFIISHCSFIIVHSSLFMIHMVTTLNCDNLVVIGFTWWQPCDNLVVTLWLGCGIQLVHNLATTLLQPCHNLETVTNPGQWHGIDQVATRLWQPCGKLACYNLAPPLLQPCYFCMGSLSNTTVSDSWRSSTCHESSHKYDRESVPFSFVRKKDDSLLFERNATFKQEYGHFTARTPFSQQLKLIIPSGEAPIKRYHSIDNQSTSKKLKIRMQTYFVSFICNLFMLTPPTCSCWRKFCSVWVTNCLNKWL